MINGIRNAKTDVMIMAAHMPNRKKLCLVVAQGNAETKYATFDSDEAAAEFMAILAEFLKPYITESEEDATR